METDFIVEGLRKEITYLHTRLDKLRVQAKLAEKEAQDALQPEMKRLESELSNAKERLSKLADVSAEVLEESKKGLEGAFNELRLGVERAFDKLKNN